MHIKDRTLACNVRGQCRQVPEEQLEVRAWTRDDEMLFARIEFYVWHPGAIVRIGRGWVRLLAYTAVVAMTRTSAPYRCNLAWKY